MNKLPQSITALSTGVLMGLGLCIAQMIDPKKVVNFLDIFGTWDPSLAFVMGGGLAVNALLTVFIAKRNTPVFGDKFRLPALTQIDWRIIGGGVCFGIGWGLAGYCPGPMLVSLSFVDPDILVIVIAYIAGTFIAKQWIS